MAAYITIYDNLGNPIEIPALVGNTGRGINSITKTNTSGLYDTYTIAYSDNTSSTFTVKNGERGIQGSPGIGVPDGGTEGQVLTRTANGTTWANPTGGGGEASLPTGGTAGQVLAKQSSVDGDAAWIDAPSLSKTQQIIHVDSANGNDTTGTGSSDAPYATIQKAIDSAPTVSTATTGVGASWGATMISIASGTYNESLSIAEKSISIIKPDGDTGTLTINGNLWLVRNAFVGLLSDVTVRANSTNPTNGYTVWVSYGSMLSTFDTILTCDANNISQFGIFLENGGRISTSVASGTVVVNNAVNSGFVINGEGQAYFNSINGTGNTQYGLRLWGGIAKCRSIGSNMGNAGDVSRNFGGQLFMGQSQIVGVRVLAESEYNALTTIANDVLYIITDDPPAALPKLSLMGDESDA